MGNNYSYAVGSLGEMSFIPPTLVEKYIRFNIPVLCDDIFSPLPIFTSDHQVISNQDQVLTYKGNIFVSNYAEAFISPLDTKLGKALYAKTSK
ncbi:MAG: hypothetical protein HC836_47390 [Richelia sp. RM2_1_2]|nr:hypothetical protein [Richelia sp. RM2_1_2]